MKFTINYIPEKHNSKPNYSNRMISYSDVVIRRPFKNMSSGEGEVGFLVKVEGTYRRFRYDRIIKMEAQAWTLHSEGRRKALFGETN